MNKYILTFLCLFFLYPSTQAQTDNTLNAEFKKLMLAFPGNFQSLCKGEYDPLWERYETTVRLPGAILPYIRRENDETVSFFECTIDIPDYYTSEQYKEQFARWATRIGALDLNGAKMAEFTDLRYADKKNWFIAGKAWRLDNSRNTIAAVYQPFVIRLELLDLDQGGWHLRIVVGHRDIQTGI